MNYHARTLPRQRRVGDEDWAAKGSGRARGVYRNPYARAVADVNEELVRRYFELKGYFVRTNVRYKLKQDKARNHKPKLRRKTSSDR